MLQQTVLLDAEPAVEEARAVIASVEDGGLGELELQSTSASRLFIGIAGSGCTALVTDVIKHSWSLFSAR